MKKQALGIDINKNTLDYYAPNESETFDWGQIANEVSAIEAFLQNYSPEEVFLVVEPTGTYGDKLMELAHDHGFEIRVANPQASSHFSAAIGMINKTDKNAARMLAKMGMSLDLTEYNPPSEQLKERKQLQMALDALSKQVGMLANQIHALTQRLKPSKVALNALKKSLKALEKEKKILEKELRDLSDEESEDFFNLVTSIPGIGPKSAQALLIYTNGLKSFDNKAQLAKFVGVVPSKHTSGTSVYKNGKITKNGPTRLRAILFFAARSAIKFNNACKGLFDRLRKRGKPYKLAMVAVVKKMLHQVFAVVKSKNVFDNQLYLNINTKNP